jgi:GTPase-associated protein 1, N-terminal domain type 2
MSNDSCELHQVTYANCQPGFGRTRRGGYDVRAWTAGIDSRWLDEMPALARWPGADRVGREARAALVERPFGRALVRVVPSVDATGTRGATFAHAIVGPAASLTAPKALSLLATHPWKDNDDEMGELPSVPLGSAGVEECNSIETIEGQTEASLLMSLLHAALGRAVPCTMFEADHELASRVFRRIMSLLPKAWRAELTWSTWENRPGDRSIRLAAFRSSDNDIVRQLARNGQVRLARDIHPTGRFVAAIQACVQERAMERLTHLFSAADADGLTTIEELDVLAGAVDAAWQPTVAELQVLESALTLRKRLSPLRYVPAVMNNMLTIEKPLVNLTACIRSNDAASDLLRDSMMELGRQHAAVGKVCELGQVLSKAVESGCNSTCQMAQDILEAAERPSMLSPDVAAMLLYAATVTPEGNDGLFDVGRLRPIRPTLIESICRTAGSPLYQLRLLLRVNAAEPSTSAIIASSIVRSPQLLDAWAKTNSAHQPDSLLRELAARLPNGLLGAAAPHDASEFSRFVEIDTAGGRLDTLRAAVILIEQRLEPSAELLQRIALAAFHADGKIPDSYRTLLESHIGKLEPTLQKRLAGRLKSDDVLFGNRISSESLRELPLLLADLSVSTREWVRRTWWPQATTVAIQTGKPYADDLVFGLSSTLGESPLTLLCALADSSSQRSSDVLVCRLFRLLAIHAGRCPRAEYATISDLLRRFTHQHLASLSDHPGMERLLNELPEAAWRLAALLLRERRSRRAWFGLKREVAI